MEERAPKDVRNLDAATQEKELRLGLVALVVALTSAALLSRSGAPAGYRALVFVPFCVAAYGVLAGLFATCGVTALAGCRITPQGREPIADRADLEATRAHGVKVLLSSAVAAAITTGLFVIAR